MMAAPVKLSPDGQSLETGTPAALFPVRIAGGPLPSFNKEQYAVSSEEFDVKQAFYNPAHGGQNIMISIPARDC